MGYYSEVALCFNKQGYEKFQEELEKQSDETKNDFAELKGSAIIKETDESILFYWDHLKWYEYFPSVGFIEAFLHTLPDGVTENDFLFLRVGEYLIDNQFSGEFWNNPFSLSLERHIGYV